MIYIYKKIYIISLYNLFYLYIIYIKPLIFLLLIFSLENECQYLRNSINK